MVLASIILAATIGVGPRSQEAVSYSFRIYRLSAKANVTIYGSAASVGKGLVFQLTPEQVSDTVANLKRRKQGRLVSYPRLTMLEETEASVVATGSENSYALACRPTRESGELRLAVGFSMRGDKAEAISLLGSGRPCSKDSKQVWIFKDGNQPKWMVVAEPSPD